MMSAIKSTLILVLATASQAVLPVAASFASPDAAPQRLAVVGGDTLTTLDLDAEIFASMASAKGARIPAPEPDAALKRLIQNRLLEQEGYRIGADQAPAVQNQVKEFIRLKSMQALLDSVSAPRPGEPQEDVEGLVGQVGVLRRYSHILVKQPGVAATMRDSLAAGVPFADLAKRHSIDGTAVQGGDLGWAAQGIYVQAFEEAAGRLAMNEISAPVETQFGWHLIQLTGTKSDTLKSRAMAEALVEARAREMRDARVVAFVDSLRTAYGVTTNDSLLSTLNYGTKDPAVMKELQESPAVLAVLPSGKLTVRALTRSIRFQYFHGLADRTDAAQIRDRMFRDYVNEGLLGYEARKRGFDRKPDLLAKAKREERRLIREEVLGHILDVKFAPGEDEIRNFYETHKTDFIPAARVKVQSVMVKEPEAARRLRQEMDSGSGLKWLATQHAAEVDSSAPFPAEWIPAAMVGLKDADVREGLAIGPLELPGGWALAQIVAIEEPAVAPLEKCREKVLQAMKGETLRSSVEDALARLEAATDIRIEEGASRIVAEHVQRMQPQGAEGEKP